MEIRNARDCAGWYGSYLDDQGESLIDCLENKIIQQEELLYNILGEIELTESPKEVKPEIVLNSIKCMILQQENIETKRGYFGWIYPADEKLKQNNEL